MSVGALWLVGALLSAPYKQAIGDLQVYANLSGRSAQFSSRSGATLRGWLLPGGKDQGAVLLLHGVRATRLTMLDRARFLAQAGFTVFLFDFQAHGESSGEQITFGYLESQDAQAAVKFLQQTAPGEKIGVIGASMGGAAALLASPPLDAHALILEAVYPSIEQATADRLTLKLGGWAGRLAPLLTLQLKPRLGFDAGCLRPIDKVGRNATPKLFIAGAADRHTPLQESMELFNAAAEPKDFWAVPGARHVDLHEFARAEYEARVLAFLVKHLR